MKQFMITSTFVFISLITYAQDQKWSVEANYPFTLKTAPAIGEINGVLDLGAKYRFIDVGIFKLGAGVNISYFREYDNFTYGSQNGDVFFDYKKNIVILQPKVFGELEIPNSKLKPHLGLGYSILFNNTYSNNNNDIVYDLPTSSDGGLNINLGLSYDITKRIFVQVQWDYFWMHYKGTTNLSGESYSFSIRENLSIFKVGIGFRF